MMMMIKNRPLFNPMLFLIVQVLLLIVERHAVGVFAEYHHNFQWEGLHPKQQQQQQHHEHTIRQRQRRRTSGIKGGGGSRHVQDAAAVAASTTSTTATTTTTTTTSGNADDGITSIFPYMALKKHSGDNNKSKYKLKKQQQNYGERDCGWGRKNVVVHTVYDSRNIEDAKPNDYMSGLGFAFDVVSLSSSGGDDDDDDTDVKLNGHWTQTVLAISENIRIGHDELTFYQSSQVDDDTNNADNNTTDTDVVQGHDNPAAAAAVAGVLTTQFDSTLNVAIVTAGSGLFECAQGNPQVEFEEGSTLVTIVWDLCVCETAMMPPTPPAYEEEEEEEDEEDEDDTHDEAPEEEDEQHEEEPMNDRNHTAGP